MVRSLLWVVQDLYNLQPHWGLGLQRLGLGGFGV